MTLKTNLSPEIIFGIHPIVELLKAKRRPIRVLYTTQPAPKAWSSIKNVLPAHIPVKYVSRDQLTKLAGTSDHQGFVAAVGQFPFRKKFFDPQRSPFLIFLDGIQDPRNLGAIIRSAYCTNVDGIILGKKNCAPLNAVAIKSSAGLAEHMEIYEAASIPAVIQELKQQGYQVYLAVFNGQDARTVDFKTPLCLVVGSEGSGISPQLLGSGQPITLAQKTADVSYNASVAAGILLFMISSMHKKI